MADNDRTLITDRETILVVDDSEFNRELLCEMLENDYNVLEAADGRQAVAVLEEKRAELSLVLLDITMPVLDGFGVLEYMSERDWIEHLPVIMITADPTPGNMHRAYNLGATDFISRPFDFDVVKRRVYNTMVLYKKQKHLRNLVEMQNIENIRQSEMMVMILSHVVESRNGESGLHVLHINILTEFLLNKLLQITDKYSLTEQDVEAIAIASEFHDVGKIMIPDEIINKPGKLTQEEFAVIKTHTTFGHEMLNGVPMYQNEQFMIYAKDICRYHHERYDGRGYPDGLKGDEIPIWAQIVSLADVYDALTSERCYKKAFSHEKAVEMILNGECGIFNPLLMQCVKELGSELEKAVNGSADPQERLKRLEQKTERHLRREGVL